MKKHLALKAEHLAELTADELRRAGGAADDSFTGRIECIASVFQENCLTSPFVCAQTALCHIG